MLFALKTVLACLVVALSLTLAPGFASAQVISQTTADWLVGNSGLGQTFTATVTGTVTHVQIRPVGTSADTTIRFYNGSGSGSPSSIGTPVSSQPVTLVDQLTLTEGFQTIELASPLPIVAGNTYTFLIDSNALAAATSDRYAGGSLIADFNSVIAGFDLAFTVTQVAAPVSVPTLSEWAMVLFGTVLVGGAVLLIQRRKMVA